MVTTFPIYHIELERTCHFQDLAILGEVLLDQQCTRDGTPNLATAVHSTVDPGHLKNIVEGTGEARPSPILCLPTFRGTPVRTELQQMNTGEKITSELRRIIF